MGSYLMHTYWAILLNTFIYEDCSCNVFGSVSTACYSNGACICKENVDGEKCNSCKLGYFPFPDCDKGKIYKS